MSAAYTEEQVREIEKASNKGERVVYLYQNDCYYAHLALYRFAVPMAGTGRVLDAGCGTGYGSDYLVEHGAKSVVAVDYSEDAIAFCQQHFNRPNLEFRRMDVSRITSLPEHAFDLIFSSNTLEHVPRVTGFCHAACRLMKPDGTLVVAVPPIVDEKTRTNDLSNRYHLHIWSPVQWAHMLGTYFEEVEGFRHRFGRDDVKLDFLNKPEDCRISEEDFKFSHGTPEEMKSSGTLTALFTARRPRPAADLPAPDAPVEFIDESFSRRPPSWLRGKASDLLRRLVKRG